MKSYLDKFNKLFKGKQSIEIEFFDEEPLSKKYVRYNQSGEVCRSPEGSNQATQRIKNGWQQINCDTYNCQYRQKNEYGKLLSFIHETDEHAFVTVSTVNEVVGAWNTVKNR